MSRHERLEVAWGLIANAYEGDWSKAPAEWREAAERFAAEMRSEGGAVICGMSNNTMEIPAARPGQCHWISWDRCALPRGHAGRCDFGSRR